MERNIAHQNLSGIATEFNFTNYPIRNILSILHVTEYFQKHVQKIQLTKQQKEFLSDHKTTPIKYKSFFKARATPLGHLFVSRCLSSSIPQSEKIKKPMLQTTWFRRNNMWQQHHRGDIPCFYQEFYLTFVPSIYLVN